MDAVTMIDLDTGQVLGIAEIGPHSYSEGTLLIDSAGDHVYVTNPDDFSLSILDAKTLETVTTLGSVDLVALDAQGGRLVVADTKGLRVLNTAEHDPSAEVLLPRDIKLQALTIDPTAERIALAYKSDGTDTLALYDATTLDGLGTLPIPGSTTALLFDPIRGRLHVALNDGSQHLLWTLDSGGDLLREQRLVDSIYPIHLAIDPEGTRLFVAREIYQDNGVTILDLQTGQEIADVPLDLPPGDLVWDRAAERLLVSHPYYNRVDAVDLSTGQVSDVFFTAINLVDLAVDPTRNHLYITDSTGQLYVLDDETDKPLATLPGAGRIALDSPHGRLYTGGREADRMRMFDTDALAQIGEIRTKAVPVADAHSGGLYLVERGVYLTSLESMTITGVISDTLPQNPGYSPNPTAVDAVVDPGSGRLFAIITNGVPGSNGGTYLYVYEPETYQKVLTDTERSPLYLDVDPATGRAYVSRIHMTNRSTSLLTDGREYTARLESVYGSLRVDPGLGRVYLNTFGGSVNQMFILDAETLHVLDSVPIPAGFSIRALDPQKHRLYLATSEGQVQVWSATGGQLAPTAEAVAADLAERGPYQLFLPPDDEPLFAVDKDYRLHRSDDQGQTWEQIAGGLPDEWVLDVAFSPEFAQDQTLFAGLATMSQGFGVWKSTDGGHSWRITSAGLTDLAVEELDISPTFAQDQTLCAETRRDGLFCSDDGGQSWTSVPEGSPYAFSSSFVQDRHQYAWTNHSGLLRSTDSGQTWQAAGVGLAITDVGSGRVIVSAESPSGQAIYFIWSPTHDEGQTRFYRSLDRAASWERLVGESPQGATPVELTGDGVTFLALDEAGRLLRWPVAELEWEPASMPPIDQVAVEHLVLSPGFVQDQTLFALSGAAGILRSNDAGLTWTETGFPARTTYSLQEELVVASLDSLFLGTGVGLYHLDDDGVWTIVGGGLPRGAAANSPAIDDGALRVLVSGENEGDGPRVFLSTDEGQTWTKPLPDLPRYVDRDGFHFSPAFTANKTAFAVVSWEKPLRSVAGGAWEEFGPPGEWLSNRFAMSPAFDRDGLLFLALENLGLWRSTDAGDSWAEIETPWAGERLYRLIFSPAFAQDGMLFAWPDDNLYRSTDQGSTWAQVLDLGKSYFLILFAPGYAGDGEIYIFQSGTLFHSTDGGQAWQALPQAPWDPYTEVHLRLSPTFAQDRTLLAWQSPGRYFESSDGGRSWREINQGLPPGGIRDVIFSPEYASDKLLYLVPYEAGLYKRIGDSAWLPITEHAPPPRPSPTTTPMPPPTPTPMACAAEPERFLAVWQQAGVRAKLGCPQQAAEQLALAEQRFERGRMIWDSGTRQVYVLLAPGSWQAYDDTWTPDQLELDPALVPPADRVQPQRGFGKVWREQLGGSQAAIGWALEGERPVTGWHQPFDGGSLIWTDAKLEGSEEVGAAYLLFQDGTWQAVSAPSP
jgi:DNA-binding beta-propeller fold protein YncE/photosystem II stability/assembly factor-like uncharacterized protein